MRDKRFVAEHRGGPLTKDQHRSLMRWACACAQHVLPLLGKNVDGRLLFALKVGNTWAEGKATVGDARKASVGAHQVARESSDRTTILVARAVGHAVATAHMADHSLGPAYYALKAMKNAGQSIKEERRWQDEQLPSDVRDLVLSARMNKKFSKL